MGCPSWAEIDDAGTLTFSVCTHDPDTGILTDADSAPTYRIYEDETAEPIATGTMAKLDDGNTIGFYTECITTSAANGYEHGKSYTIYIEATVDGNTGGITYAFKAFSSTAFASALGNGAIAWDYIVTDADNGLPLNEVDVWVTSDAVGLDVLASGQTGQNGTVTFMLDAGTVYVWSRKAGWNFSNPDEEVVS